MTFFSSLAQIIQVSSSCPSTFIDSILCAWQYARSWLGIQCQAKHSFLYSGPTSSAPTYYANSLSGFIILLVLIFCTLIFSYSTTNSKQILLICHPCQVIPSSTILRPRQKESLPWALHFREPTLAPTLAPWPGTSSWSEKSAEFRACSLTPQHSTTADSQDPKFTYRALKYRPQGRQGCRQTHL